MGFLEYSNLIIQLSLGKIVLLIRGNWKFVYFGPPKNQCRIFITGLVITADT